MRNIPFGMLMGAMRNLGVAWRLMQMPTVSPWIRFLLPLLALLYYFIPFDLMPGLPFDDLFVVLIIFPSLMIRLAPPEAVEAARTGHTREQAEPVSDDDVIDAPWQSIK